METCFHPRMHDRESILIAHASRKRRGQNGAPTGTKTFGSLEQKTLLEEPFGAL